jgi:hypothetical protein
MTRLSSSTGVCKRAIFHASLLLAAILVPLVLPFALRAQLNTGRISGQITDQTGGAVAGATVTVTDVARGESRTLTSDAAGDYAAPNLTPDIYTVKAEFMGFQTVQRENVEVTVGGDIRVDVSLQPGATTQTVTVTESIPVVNTTNAQTGGVLENKLLTDLPTIGRNYRWQQSLVPGVQVQMGSASTTFSVDVNGTTDGHATNSLIDGLYEQNYFTGEVTFGGSGEAGFTTILPLDAIQEVNLTTNPKAEYGWVPGVTTSIGLKSGANDLHGEAYAFGRDTAMSAKNAFAPGPTPLGFEQFGGNLGGPIKKNKLFYFGSYEGFREEATSITGNIVAPLSTSGAGITQSIPDAITDVINSHGGVAALNQLSLNLAGCNYPAIHSMTAPTTSAAVAANCVTNQFGAAGLWNNTSLGQVPDAGHSDNGIIKVDYHLNDHHEISGSFAYGTYEENAAGNSSAKITQNYWEELLGVTGNMARIVEIWTPNSNWLNEARWGRDQSIRPVARAECAANGDLSNPTGVGASTGGFGGPNYLTQYGLLSGAPGCGIPTITLASPITAQLGFSNSRSDNEVDEQGADSLSYTRGAHQFKFGTDIRAITVVGAKTLDSQAGAIGFGASGDAAFSGASALEDFLVGAPSSEQIRSGSPIRTTGTYLIGLFAQDDWRIKPRLTLNLGLREEIDTAPTSNTDNLGNFAPGSPSGIVALTQPFKNQYTLEPRVGFAYDITGKGTTTLRASGGVLHALITLMNFIGGGSTTASNYDNAPTGELLCPTLGCSTAGAVTAPGDGKSAFVSFIPQSNASKVISFDPILWPSNNSATTALFPSPIAAECGNGLPVNGSGTTVSGSNPLNPAQCLMSGGDPSLKYYRYYFWNVNFQHAFTNNLSLDIGYIGSRTNGIIQSINLNQAQPTDVAANATPLFEETHAPFYSQYPWFSSIFYQTGGQNDSYRSLQIYLIERPTHGLSFTGSYTYAGNFESQGVQNVNVPVVGVDGPYSDNLYPAHNLAITTTYVVPGIKVPGQLLQGWTASARISYISGVPQTFLDTTNDLTGAGTAGTAWTLSGPAQPFNKIFGRAGTIPCYGVAAGTGVSQSVFSKAANCTSVLAGSSTTPWSNMPAACIQAAQNEPSFTTGLAANASGTGLAQLAAVGCYMVNGSAIVPPAQGTYGTMLPDAITGPGYSGLDASLSKDWKFKERYTAQFRLEAFNLFNRTIYTGASNNLGNPKSFGLATFTPDNAHGDPIQSRGGPRYLQLGLKLFF